MALTGDQPGSIEADLAFDEAAVLGLARSMGLVGEQPGDQEGDRERER